MDWNTVWTNIVNWLTTNGVRLIIGLVVLFIVFKVINAVSKRIKKTMEKRKAEKTIISVVYAITRNGLKILALVCFVGYVGIDVSGISALIASCGVAIGLALQGALSNLAGGILIIILKPFRLDDYIEAQGQGGTVEEISLFYTHMVTPDNKVVMVPNGALLNGNIVNFSKKNTRRVDLAFTISYGEDFERAIAAIKSVCAENDMILKTPEPLVRVSAQKDSCVEIATKVWTNTENYWTIYFAMQEAVKKRFDLEKIAIPFPQLDVHLDKEN